MEGVEKFSDDLQVILTMLRYRDSKEELTDYINENKKFFQNVDYETSQAMKAFLNMKQIPGEAVRRMINKYTALAAIDLHITPHMFRHTFATSLLEADVDIRYIQEMLGHSSINITEIYTHVALAKQRSILATKHPRNNFNI